jgi:hypothetical protein
MFTISLSNARLSLLIFAFAHHRVTHLVVLSIFLFHYVPHILISSKFLRGLAKLDLLDIPKVLLHILSSMLEINHNFQGV